MARDREKTTHPERGANLVEMALVLPLLMLLLIGVVDIGRAFNHYIVITNAAREGARRASRTPIYLGELAVDAIEAAVRQEAANSGVDLSSDNAIITIGASQGLSGGNPISVTVHYTFTTIIGGLTGLPEFSMRNSTEMVIFGN